MRCTFCEKEAVLRLRHANLRLCPEHLVARVEKEAEKAIREFHMFTPEEKILVAVSGGKDSLGLWQILTKLGYQADGLYIHLGIEGYSRAFSGILPGICVRTGANAWKWCALRTSSGRVWTKSLKVMLRGEPCAHCGARLNATS